MRSWVMLVPCLVVAVGCGPSWKVGDFGPQVLCGELTRNDHIVKAELVSVGKPVQLEVSLWPDEPPSWHTPMTMRVVERWRGDATGDIEVVTPYPVDFTLNGVPVRHANGSAYPTWSFLRFIDGHYWLDGADLGTVYDDGRVWFPNATHDSEKTFLDALRATSEQPECAMILPSRLDGK